MENQLINATPLPLSLTNLKRKNFSLPLLGLLLILSTSLITITAVINSSSKPKSTATKASFEAPTPTITLRPLKKEGSLLLKMLNDKTSYSIGQPIKLNVIASSEGRDIVGLDCLFSFDKTAFDLTKVTSLVSSFSAFEKQKKEHLTISLLKTPQIKEPAIFQNTSVIEMILTAKKAGNFSIELKSVIGNEKTQLVDDKVVATSPDINSLTVEIK